MVASDSWRDDLEKWLAPFLTDLTHPAQRRMCPMYVAGLIGPGDRKSIQPLAARRDDVGYDQLHHFIASGTWDTAPLESRLLAEADRLVGDAKGYLVIDDTALPKKGRASVGVAPQYASSQGKTANCQSLVSVTLASREVPVMVGLRLFLPESWTNEPERMKRARVPAERQLPTSKPDIAIAEIDRVMAAGTRFGCVLADAGYGSGAAFRQALSERGLSWAVGLSSRQTVYAFLQSRRLKAAGRKKKSRRTAPATDPCRPSDRRSSTGLQDRRPRNAHTVISRWQLPTNLLCQSSGR